MFNFIKNITYKIFFLYVMFISISLNNSLYPGEIISISEQISAERIGKYLDYYEDLNNESNAKEIFEGKEDSKFKNSTEQILNLGFIKSQFWLRFSIQNNSINENNFLVEYEFAGIDELEFYSQEINKSITSSLTGDHLPFSSRIIPHKNFIFPIKIPPGETRTFLIRLKTETTFMAPINIWNYKDLYLRDYRLLFIFGCFFGVCAILGMFHHLLYYSFKDKTFLYYSFKVASIVIYLSGYYGFTFQYIIPDFPKINTYVILYSAMFIMIFGNKFYIEFLGIKPNYKKILNILNIFFYTLMITLLFIPFLGFTNSIKVISIYAIVWNIITLIVALFMIFQGNLYAKFYFISGIFFLIFVGSNVMSNFNLIPRNTFTMYGFIVNFSTEVTFFSLALSIRLQMIKNEKVEIERKSGEFKEKLNSIQMEIETASRIHRTILPSETPNIEGLDIYAVYIPSNTIGGDYYDFHHKDNKLGVFIADVTGHGIPASLFASSVKYCFSKGIKYFIEPNRLLSYMNSSLYQKLGNQLLTASFILIDPATKTISYASCGHPPLLIWKSKENTMLEIKPKGAMIGVHAETNIEKVTLKVESGDRILLYTDGLTECSNPEGVEYGDSSLIEFFKKVKGLKAKNTSNLLLKDLSKFSGAKVRYQDDITYILIDIL
jgi:two-component system, sensor histidine kinase LadS